METRSSSLRTVSGAARLFRRDRDGVVAIEFALIAPVLVLMLLGTTSLTNSIWANAKVDRAANIIGDLVSQGEELEESGSAGDSLFALMSAAPALIAPFAGDQLSVRVTQILACYANPNSPNSDITYFVVWSREWTKDATALSRPSGYNNGAPVPTDLGNLRIPDSGYLIMTEVSYRHEPPIKISSTMVLDMEERAFHQPRNDEKISLSTAGAGNDIACADLI